MFKMSLNLVVFQLLFALIMCQGRFIESFDITGCVATPGETEVGDDRGGIASDNSNFYANGDTRAGRFSMTNPIVITQLSGRIDAIFSDLSNGDLYTFGESSTIFFQSAGTQLTHIIPIDSTGTKSGASLALNPAIQVNPVSYGSIYGAYVFADEGFVHVKVNSTLYSIDLSSANYTTTAIQPNIYAVNYFESENWAQYGFVEKIRGVPYVTAACRDFDYAAGGPALCRTNLQTLEYSYLNITGYKQNVTGYSYVADMASMTLSPMSSSNPATFIYHTEGSFAGERYAYCRSGLSINVCGNGILNPTYEDCDDGNVLPGDGCYNCLVEAGYSCDTTVQPSVCKRPGGGSSSTASSSNPFLF